LGKFVGRCGPLDNRPARITAEQAAALQQCDPLVIAAFAFIAVLIAVILIRYADGKRIGRLHRV